MQSVVRKGSAKEPATVKRVSTLVESDAVSVQEQKKQKQQQLRHASSAAAIR